MYCTMKQTKTDQKTEKQKHKETGTQKKEKQRDKMKGGKINIQIDNRHHCHDTLKQRHRYRETETKIHRKTETYIHRNRE